MQDPSTSSLVASTGRQSIHRRLSGREVTIECKHGINRRFTLALCYALLMAFVHTGHAIKWLSTGNTSWNSSLDCSLTAIYTYSSLSHGVATVDSQIDSDVISIHSSPMRLSTENGGSHRHVLSKPQKQICLRHIDMMSMVSFAARQTIDLCQELFAERRWNCSSITSAPRFLPDLTGGSREQAFVYALSSAALLHTVAKSCATGQSSKCHCGPTPDYPPPTGHRWGGCSDDLAYAVSFTEQFTDSQWTSTKRQRSKRAMVNLHNNAAGRQIVSENLRTTCKCHGVSGACTIKTCWRALPDIRAIAMAVQRRHAVAVEVKTASWPESTTGSISGSGGRRRRLVPSVPGQTRDGSGNDVMTSGKATTSGVVGPADLVYYTISPDYCLPDITLGSVGTRHRECRRDDDGPSGCQSMCCGRGHQTLSMNVTQRCDCKYYWCCYVRCKTCSRIVQLHRCR